MKKSSTNVHFHDPDIYNVKADIDLYWVIANDMLENAGKFAPRSVWQRLDDAADYSTYKPGAERYKELVLTPDEMKAAAEKSIASYPNMEDMLDAWVGPRGKRDVLDEKLLQRYRDYLEQLGDASFYDAFRKSENYKIMSDFLSVEEVTILHKELYDKEQVNVLEIGGGYGRLCEAFFNTFEECGHYVLADSVPLSLMYAYLYLCKALPDKKVGIYYFDTDPTKYDCYIVPTWRLEEVFGNASFGLVVNIQSMQEMSQWHVDYYLDFFDNHLEEDGIIYLNNNKRYVFKGQWNYPAHWSLHFRHNSPWAWSSDCPIEVFIKKKTDFTNRNKLVDYAHVISSHMEYEQLPELQKKASEYAKLIARYDTLKTERDSLKIERDTLKRERNTLETKCNAIETKKEALTKNRDALLSEKEHLLSEVGKLTGSFSWRITKPLRVLGRVVRKK